MDAIKFAKWAAVIIGVIVLIKLLRDWGLLGKTDEEINTEKFNDLETFKPEFIKTAGFKIAKKLNKPVNQLNAQDLNKFMPSLADTKNFVKSLADAKSVWDDDETKIYSAFRSVKSQFYLNRYNKYFVETIKKSIPDYLADFMNEKEISKIYTIIKNKPII